MSMKYKMFGWAATMLGVASAFAGDGDGLWGWNVSAGANFGFGLKSNLKTSPYNAMQRLPALHPAIGKAKPASGAQTPVVGGDRVDYGGDANGAWYVDPKSSWGEDVAPNETINWRLPESMHQGDAFVIDSGEWGELASESVMANSVGGSDRDVAYGASVDLSHVLWASESGVWGVDIAFGLSWMRANDCYNQSGIAITRSAAINRGRSTTEIPADCLTDPYASYEADNTWGAAAYDGSLTTDRRDYIIDLNRIRTSEQTFAKETYSDTTRISTDGDYEEWELSLLFKPWYDVNDWMCLHGALGLGVTRSSFDYSMNAICNGATVYQSSEEFSEWRCYGIVGAGVVFRVWDFDLSVDGLFRWCQQDMDIDGRDVQGSIEKPWGVLRLGLSYAF